MTRARALCTAPHCCVAVVAVAAAAVVARLPHASTMKCVCMYMRGCNRTNVHMYVRELRDRINVHMYVRSISMCQCM